MNLCVTVVFSGLLFSVASCPLRAQVQKETEGQQSCRKFVQAFYDWYAPMAAGDHAGRSSDRALKDKRAAFSSELARGLEEDSKAQSNANEIVGLDFDPFLGGQDTCEPYSLKRVIRTGSKCWVEVYGNSCEKRPKPDVVAELELKDGMWSFVNFRYPNLGKDTNLLNILKQLSAARKKSKAK